MKLSVHSNPKYVLVIQELLSVWDISWVSPEDADVVIVYGRKSLKTPKKTILIPSSSNDFSHWSEHFKPSSTLRPGKQILVAATPAITLTITPEVLYDVDPSTRDINQDFIILQFDVVKEYDRIVQQTLTARSSTRYRLATSFPLSYNMVPKRFRDYFMKKHDKHKNLSLCNILPMDALRFVLVNAIKQLSKEKLQRKTWNHRVCACALTHDVDTKEGLKKSLKVKKLEETYDMPSAWFLPSEQYSLERKIIEELGNNGEIGSHDTKHDGKLFQLSQTKLVRRLGQSKKTLEAITNQTIAGFRAPVLQHTPNLLQGLRLCGYKYDTSIPTWEARHPRTMRSHGIGTVYPTFIEGILEIPITVMQDHQFLYVLGLKPKDVILEWLSAMTSIEKLGGCCIFLSHPEYSLLDGEGLSNYEDLLNIIKSNKAVSVALPKQFVNLSTSI